MCRDFTVAKPIGQGWKKITCWLNILVSVTTNVAEFLSKTTSFVAMLKMSGAAETSTPFLFFSFHVSP